MWLKFLLWPWGMIRSLRAELKETEGRRKAEVDTAGKLVERASQIAKKVTYITVERQDDNSIPYLDEIARIAENECFIFLISECRKTLLEELMKVGSATIEEHTQKIDGDTQIKIVAVKTPENEIKRIKYMMSGIEFIELAMARDVLRLSQLRVAEGNAQISL